MLRKLILGTVAAMAIGVSANAVNAAPPIVIQPSTGGFLPQPQHRHDHDYVVFIRHGYHWDRYARYETRWEADRAVRQLERQGYRAYVQVVEDNRRY